MKKNAIVYIVVKILALIGWLWFLPMLCAQSDMNHWIKVWFYLMCGGGGFLTLLDLIKYWKKTFKE